MSSDELKYKDFALAISTYQVDPGNEQTFRNTLVKDFFGEEDEKKVIINDYNKDKKRVLEKLDINYRDNLIFHLASQMATTSKTSEYKKNVDKIRRDSYFCDCYYPHAWGLLGTQDVLAITKVDEFVFLDHQSCEHGANTHRSMLGLVPECMANNDFFKNMNIFSRSKATQIAMAKKFPFVTIMNLQLNLFVPNYWFDNSKKKIFDKLPQLIENSSRSVRYGEDVIFLALDCFGWQDIVLFLFSKSTKYLTNSILNLRSWTLDNLIDKMFSLPEVKNKQFSNYLANCRNNYELIDNLVREFERVCKEMDGFDVNMGASHSVLNSTHIFGFNKWLDCRQYCENPTACNYTIRDRDKCRKIIQPIIDILDRSVKLSYYTTLRVKPGHADIVKSTVENHFQSLIPEFLNNINYTITPGELRLFMDALEHSFPLILQAYAQTMADMRKTNYDDHYSNSDIFESMSGISSPWQGGDDKKTSSHPYHHVMFLKIEDRYYKRWRELLTKIICKLNFPRVLRDKLRNLFSDYFRMLSDPELFNNMIDLYPNFRIMLRQLQNFESQKVAGNIDDEEIDKGIIKHITIWAELMNDAINAAYQNSVKENLNINLIPDSKHDVSKCLNMINGILRELHDITDSGNSTWANSVALLTSERSIISDQIWSSHFIKLNSLHFFSPEFSLLSIFHEGFHFLQSRGIFLETSKKIDEAERNLINNYVSPRRLSDRPGYKAMAMLRPDICPDYFQLLFLFDNDIDLMLKYQLAYIESNIEDLENFWHMDVPVYLIRIYIVASLSELISDSCPIFTDCHLKTPQSRHKLADEFVNYYLDVLTLAPGRFNRIEKVYSKIDPAMLNVISNELNRRAQSALNNDSIKKFNFISNIDKWLTRSLQNKSKFCPQISEKWRESNSALKNATLTLWEEINFLETAHITMTQARMTDAEKNGEAKPPLCTLFNSVLSNMLEVYTRWKKDYKREETEKISEVTITGIPEEKEIIASLQEGKVISFQPGCQKLVSMDGVRFVSRILIAMFKISIRMNSGADSFFWRRSKDLQGRIDIRENEMKGHYYLDPSGGGFSLSLPGRRKLLLMRFSGISSLNQLGDRLRYVNLAQLLNTIDNPIEDVLLSTDGVTC